MSMFNYGMFCYYIDKECVWFRLFGYGLRIINRDKVEPLFSIRNGYTKEWRVGKWGIIVLKPREF